MAALVGAIIGGVVGGAIGGLLYAFAPKRADGTQPGWVRVAVALCVTMGLTASRPLVPVVTRLIDEYRPKTRVEEFEFRHGREMEKHPDVIRWVRNADPKKVSQETRDMAARGMLRVSDRIVIDATAAYGRTLVRLPLDVCSRIVSGTADAADGTKMMEATLDEDVDIQVHASVTAMAAELRGYPEPRLPTDDEVFEAVEALKQVDPEAQNQIDKGFGAGATAEGKCESMRFIYMRVKSVPDRYQGTLARAVRM